MEYAILNENNLAEILEIKGFGYEPEGVAVKNGQKIIVPVERVFAAFDEITEDLVIGSYEIQAEKVIINYVAQPKSPEAIEAAKAEAFKEIKTSAEDIIIKFLANLDPGKQKVFADELVNVMYYIRLGLAALAVAELKSLPDAGAVITPELIAALEGL